MSTQEDTTAPVPATPGLGGSLDWAKFTTDSTGA